MAAILIIEDESVIRGALRRLLERHGHQVTEAPSVKHVRDRLDLARFDLVIADLRLPGAAGVDLIKPAGDTPVLIMTSYASMESAVDSMKMGAVDYIAKPFDHAEMIAAVDAILESRADDRRDADTDSCKEQPNVAGMIGSCSAMRSLYRQVDKVAPTTTTVLVQGETGTGKELVARAIHAASNRADKPLICVNCAAIPETLIESELFGYEKGAFTGAAANRMGLIEAADAGTLFLDEIGELPLEAQARLLRFLQEGEIRAIGSVQTRKVDVRLLAATHRDLEALAAQSRFREDLFYRINVVQLKLPPLRERGKDILDIAETFLARMAARFDKPDMRFSPRAVQAITTYRWPGNVRELQNAIERAVILSDDTELDYELLNIDIQLVNLRRIDAGTPASAGPRATGDHTASDPGEDLSLEDYFQRFVMEHQDTMSETELARKLGVSRKCLWERRQRLGIPRKKSSARAAQSAAGE